MPITKSAHKALRSSLRKAEVNRRIKSQVKTMIDAVKAQPTQENLSRVYSAIDRAVKNNTFHRNKGARLKAGLIRLLPKTEMGKKLEVTKKTAKKVVPKKATQKAVAKKAPAKKSAPKAKTSKSVSKK